MSTVGRYLAQRLQQIGLSDYFVVPGDFNLILLDQMLLVKELNMISCCNELNAGYAADGYSRARGAAALAVTFSVGSLSAINAIAGAYAENLPVIIISGGPNTNSMHAHQLLHHTTGEYNVHYVRDMFAKVTAKTAIIDSLETAAYRIDDAIMTALTMKKPVYIEVACNLAQQPLHEPQPLDFFALPTSSHAALTAAVDRAAEFLNQARSATLIAGAKLRAAGALDAMQQLVDASGYGVAVMPNAKGFINEAQPQYLGVYWGSVGSEGTANVVESSDAYLFAGPMFTDYSTVGFSTTIHDKKAIMVNVDHVIVSGVTFNQVYLNDFLIALSKRLKKNTFSADVFARIKTSKEIISLDKPEQPLSIRELFAQIEAMLSDKTTLVAETGDSWFNGMSLSLPQGCGFEIQMQYGSIGWATPATFGYAMATRGKKRVICCTGDGSFQLTAQEVANMIRYHVNPIIFLINNHGYTIEVEIHDGPYNNIKNWNYSDLVKVFNAEEGKALSWQVRTQAELQNAVQQALPSDQLCFIEVLIDRNDCNKNLLEWGTKVADYNSAPPKNN